MVSICPLLNRAYLIQTELRIAIKLYVPCSKVLLPHDLHFEAAQCMMVGGVLTSAHDIIMALSPIVSANGSIRTKYNAFSKMANASQPVTRLTASSSGGAMITASNSSVATYEGSSISGIVVGMVCRAITLLMTHCKLNISEM